MKYMLLIYNNPATYQAWTEEERSELFGEVDAIMKELTESGELVGGEALADASNAVTVRVRDGVRGRHRRAVRRGQGAARRVSHGRVRDEGAGGGDRRPVAGREVLRDGGPRGNELLRRRDVTTGRR